MRSGPGRRCRVRAPARSLSAGGGEHGSRRRTDDTASHRGLRLLVPARRASGAGPPQRPARSLRASVLPGRDQRRHAQEPHRHGPDGQPLRRRGIGPAQRAHGALLRRAGPGRRRPPDVRPDPRQPPGRPHGHRARWPQLLPAPGPLAQRLLRLARHRHRLSRLRRPLLRPAVGRDGPGRFAGMSADQAQVAGVGVVEPGLLHPRDPQPPAVGPRVPQDHQGRRPGGGRRQGDADRRGLPARPRGVPARPAHEPGLQPAAAGSLRRLAALRPGPRPRDPPPHRRALPDHVSPRPHLGPRRDLRRAHEVGGLAAALRPGALRGDDPGLHGQPRRGGSGRVRRRPGLLRQLVAAAPADVHAARLLPRRGPRRPRVPARTRDHLQRRPRGAGRGRGQAGQPRRLRAGAARRGVRPDHARAPAARRPRLARQGVRRPRGRDRAVHRRSGRLPERAHRGRPPAVLGQPAGGVRGRRRA